MSIPKVSMCWALDPKHPTREEEEEKFIARVLELTQSKHQPGCYEKDRKDTQTVFILN